jgi:LacI family transcriptional regulator, galactose operon repressor
MCKNQFLNYMNTKNKKSNNKLYGKHYPSIIDVAKEAGVAISTVSNVINNKDIVSKKTKKKILDTIERLNYRPNIIARGLRSKKTGTVGVIFPNINDPFYIPVLTGMQKVIRQRGYKMILGCSFYDIDEEKRLVNTLLDQFIDGIVLISGYDNDEFVNEIYQKGLPIVSREMDGYAHIPTVLVDSKDIIEKGIKYLYDFGHREIGYIGQSYENEIVPRKRYKYYRSSLKKYNIPFNPDNVIIEDYLRLNEIKISRVIVKERFKNKKIPTAFMAMSDPFAIGLMKGLEDLGYVIPDDVSVMGINNIELCDYIEPGLTTVDTPKETLGQKFMEILLKIVDGEKIKEAPILMPTKIVERESVGPPLL